MTDRVRLICPDCHHTKMVARDPTDPHGTAIIECLCDKCDDGGGFPETHYYNADGLWFDGKTFRAVP